MGKYDEEIKRKAQAGIALTNPTKDSQALYDQYKMPSSSSNKQTNTGQVQYAPLGTITNAPTASNIGLSDNMMNEIYNKSQSGTPLTNWSAQKQEIYNNFTNKAPSYIDFSYKDAPTYDSKYQGLIDSALDKLLSGTGKFEYNYKDDPLYGQYQESYRREGDRALTNSMAEATALTGGRMNSNAIVAGQQAQNYYNAQLNDKIPELENYAYQKYVQDLTDQRSNIGTMQNLENMMFGQYETELGQYNTDRSFNYGVTQDKNSYNYQNYRDQQNYLRSVLESDRNYDYNLWNTQNGLAQDQRNFDYQVGRDGVTDNQWEKQFNQAVSEFTQQLAYNKDRAAVSDNQWSQSFNNSNSQWQQSYDRGNYEYDTSRTDNLNQQAIENALKQYQAEKSTTSSTSSDYTFKDYSSQLKTMISAQQTMPGTGLKKNVYSEEETTDQVRKWYESGAITREQANKLFDMYGLG